MSTVLRKHHLFTFLLIAILLSSVIFAGVSTQSIARASETSPTKTNLNQEGCSLDLMLVLDGSGSISTLDFFNMQEFVRQMVASFEIGPRDANIGIIQFSTTAELYLGLSQDRDAIESTIDNMTQFGDSTNIAAAIDLAQAQFQTRRAGIPRVIVVLTDGLHNETGNPVAQADIARSQGTAVFGIAVGGFDFNELIDIAGGEPNVFTVSSFNGLQNILDVLLNSTCAIVTVPQPGDEDVEIGAPVEGGDVVIEYVAPEAGQTRLVFSSDRDGDHEIFIMNADGSGVQQLTFNNVNDDKPSWSKDGTRIAWESEIDADFEIFVMNADGSNQRQITDNDVNDWGPAWSPDSSQIAFHSDEAGNIDLYTMNADGTDRTQVTTNSGTDRSPSWSPDGLELIYYSDSSGGRELYRISAQGGSAVRLTNNTFYDGQPDWSLNGTGIVFGSTREDSNSEIFLMRTNGSNILRLTNSAGVDDDPVWSPDGRQIAYESDADGDFDIWIMNVDGNGAVNLTEANDSTDWSPDWIWVPGTLSNP